MAKRAKKAIWKMDKILWAYRLSNGRLEFFNRPYKGPAVFRTRAEATEHPWFHRNVHTPVRVRIVATAMEVKP